MKSIRNPKYVERYEDVVFELETALDTGNPRNNRSQKKYHRFVVDNSNSITPLDWYNARIGMSFKVKKMDNANVAANDLNGIVNGKNS